MLVPGGRKSRFPTWPAASEMGRGVLLVTTGRGEGPGGVHVVSMDTAMEEKVLTPPGLC